MIVPPNHFAHLVLQGERRHRVAIAFAAIVGLEMGCVLEDMTRWSSGPVRPDLILKKKDRTIDGPHRRMEWFRFVIEIDDTHAPDRAYSKAGGTEIHVPIRDCGTLDQIFERVHSYLEMNIP